MNERERSDTAVMDAAAKTKADAMDGGMESGGRNERNEVSGFRSQVSVNS